MANLLGDLWQDGDPTGTGPARRGRQVALVRKAEARPGRKMGHLTALSASTHVAAEQALAARRSLLEPPYS